MSFFDQAYDEMSWQEICYRLPSELSISALKRRINNLDTIKMFFDNVGAQPSSVKSLKKHVNEILATESPQDILNTFNSNYEKVLFSWLDPNNTKRIKEHDVSKLSTKFLFNITDSDNREGLKLIMDRMLNEDPVNQAHLRSVLNKASDKNFTTLVDSVLKDSRPEVRVCALGVSGLSNREMLSDHQKSMALKAMAKCTSDRPIGSIMVLNIDVFANLKPMERLIALYRYLSYFPRYEKVPAFDPVPTQSEFDMILFAGCIEHNDMVNKINTIYKQITEEDPPSDSKNSTSP
jgi:hypothetical protein